MDSGSIAASLSSVACPKVGKAQDRSLILVGSRVEWVNNIGQQWLRGAWGTDLSQMASDHAGTRAKSGFSPPLPCACAYATWIVMPTPSCNLQKRKLWQVGGLAREVVEWQAVALAGCWHHECPGLCPYLSCSCATACAVPRAMCTGR